MLAMGAGGLDVAVAMGGGAYYITYAENRERSTLSGKLSPVGVPRRTLFLRFYAVLSVKGGVGKIIEYSGEGVMSLSVPERATITNMGAELGATTSIFPSDEVTTRVSWRQRAEATSGRAYPPIDDAVYDKTIDIDLSATRTGWRHVPHSPDNVKTLSEIGKYKDRPGLHRLLHKQLLCGYDEGRIYLKGQDRSPRCHRSRSRPAQSRCLHMLAENGALADMIACGRENTGMRLRPLHRHGSVAQLKRRLAANL